ncbi:unnamed protein product, partial [Rotaria sp. Silwood2]
KPTECTYKELIEKLRSNYTRFTFPSTEHFANELHDKSAKCKFSSNFYEEALITAFVDGLQNDHVGKHLMQRSLQNFEEIINTAKTIESILIEGSTIKSTSSEDLNLNKIIQHRKQYTNHHQKSIFFSCGSTDHPRSKCRFRNATCHKCNKEGHITKA